MAYITEPAKQIKVSGSYDVVVAGGGIAGIAAALAAARQGAKTLLIEKQFMLGGLATLGLVTIYLPLCDGEGHQVSFGIAEELLRLSMKHGFETEHNVPTAWLEGSRNVKKLREKRFELRYSANVFAILAEQLLAGNGVEILYGTAVCEVAMAKDKITNVIIENKSGRSAIAVKSVVDCTGDADLCKLGNAPTKLFKQKNILAAWYYFTDSEKYKLKMLGFSDVPDKFKTDEEKKKVLPRFQGVDGVELSRMTQDAHRYLLDNFLSAGEVSDNHSLSTVATIPQIRMTRKITGEYELHDEQQHTRFEDSIGLISDWRKRGPVYEVPFATLHSNKIKNLAVAGRCISVTDDMWDISRVIPCCAVTGEAAGVAAAMSDDFSSIDISQLQQRLKKSGVVLHEADL